MREPDTTVEASRSEPTDAAEASLETLVPESESDALTPEPAHRRRRWPKRVFWTLVAGGLLYSALVARLILLPSTDSPHHVDAVVALGGSGPRVQKAIELVRAGYSNTMAMTEVYGDLGHWLPECKHPAPDFRTICFDPDLKTTQGEAEEIKEMAAKYGWHSIIVVVSTDQVTRARMLIDRCWNGKVYIVNVASRRSIFYNIAYETGAMAKALLLHRSC